MKKIVALFLCLLLCLSAVSFADEEYWICPNCGKENAGNFCGGCGTKRPEEAPAQTSEPERILTVGDTVTFGTYAGEPIEWQVLEDVGDGSYLLLSVKGLDTAPYDSGSAEVTWEDSSLRAWLNGSFYETSFSEREKVRILLSTVDNPGNETYQTPGGIATEDYVYLLSLEEVALYFGVNANGGEGGENLACLPTETALKHGAMIIYEDEVEQYSRYYRYPLTVGCCGWWLRSPGLDNTRAAFIDLVLCDRNGIRVTREDICVRPVIRVWGGAFDTFDLEPEPAEIPADVQYAVGDTLLFGSYGGEAIEWRVMEDMGGDGYILMSVSGLDSRPYHTEDKVDVTWETCSLRAWLNGEFLQTAFTSSERAKIQLSTLDNPDNVTYQTPGGGTTEDYVYLLSLDEVSAYFGVDANSTEGSSELTCLPTETALAHGAMIIYEYELTQYKNYYRYPLTAGSCGWWLRSPGLDNTRAAFIDLVLCDRNGVRIAADDVCVRPVIWVKF